MKTWGNIVFTLLTFVSTISFAQDQNTYSIVIDKSAYELRLYNQKGWIKTYPVTFGSKDLGDKMFEGDRKTPEGDFKVVLKSTTAHPEWTRFILLDYPTPADQKKFEDRKAKKQIPQYKRIGGGIAIHGTFVKQEKMVDYYYQWTDGCISLKNKDVIELYEYIKEGMMVKIIHGTSAPLPPIHEPPNA